MWISPHGTQDIYKVIGTYLLGFIIIMQIYPTMAKVEDSSKESMLERPLMERYILDELKAIRIDNQQTRVDVEERIAKSIH